MIDPNVIPADRELLEPLGLVMWAAIRLHHAVRDAINRIDGAPSDKPFDDTLGMVVAKLKTRAETVVLEPDRTALLEWVDSQARPAVKARNGVAHAVSYTAPGGRQALKGTRPGSPYPYGKDDLLAIASQLEYANFLLPRGPYALNARV